MRDELQSLLDDAWVTLESGRPDEVLAQLAQVDELEPPGDDVLGERWLIESLAWTELGDGVLAGQALGRAERHLGPDEPSLAYARGQWHLAAWRVAEARAEFERLEAEPNCLERLALCADLEGDSERADALLAEAARLDPAGFPPPPRLSEREFQAVVEEAAERLPEPLRAPLERIPVLVDDIPTRELCGSLAPDLLGLCTGASALDTSVFEGIDEPARIFLFRRNLLRACRDVDQLREEIHVTLYHELAHALGFEEGEMGELGLE